MFVVSLDPNEVSSGNQNTEYNFLGIQTGANILRINAINILYISSNVRINFYTNPTFTGVNFYQPFFVNSKNDVSSLTSIFYKFPNVTNRGNKVISKSVASFISATNINFKEMENIVLKSNSFYLFTIINETNSVPLNADLYFDEMEG